MFKRLAAACGTACIVVLAGFSSALAGESGCTTYFDRHVVSTPFVTCHAVAPVELNVRRTRNQVVVDLIKLRRGRLRASLHGINLKPNQQIELQIEGIAIPHATVEYCSGPNGEGCRVTTAPFPGCCVRGGAPGQPAGGITDLGPGNNEFQLSAHPAGVFNIHRAGTYYVKIVSTDGSPFRATATLTY